MLALAPVPGRAGTTFADLGSVRFRDPENFRELWLGFDAGGAWLPESLGLFNRTVWTAHAAPSWALALVPGITAGGRHAFVLYDAENVRIEVHDHELELSAAPLGRDRISLGAEFHRMARSRVRRASGNGFETFDVGGVQDAVVRVGYGQEHALGAEWRVAWSAGARYAWVLRDTQRHLRGSARVEWLFAPGHRAALEGTAFVIHRDERPKGAILPRVSAALLGAAEYGWMGEMLGLSARARLSTSFKSGEAPMYEAREESLDALFGEIVLGVRAVWR